MFQVNVLVSVVNPVDSIARVVDPLEVGGGLEVEHLPNLVVGCVKFNQVL